MIAYKLFRKRKDGSLGSLFVNASAKLEHGEWYSAKNHKPKRLAERPWWHCLKLPKAPHLTERGRVWCKVEIKDYTGLKRPECQGGMWLLANHLRIISEL